MGGTVCHRAGIMVIRCHWLGLATAWHALRLLARRRHSRLDWGEALCFFLSTEKKGLVDVLFYSLLQILGLWEPQTPDSSVFSLDLGSIRVWNAH